MLTNNDLNQLKKVVKDELVGFATKDDLKDFAKKDDLKDFATKDDLKGFATKDDLKSFATRDDLSGQLRPMRKDIKTLKSDVAHIRKDVKTMINFFDRDYLELRERVERIEEHLHLPLAT